MSTNKLNKKLIKNAKNRELLYAEAQEKAISEQRKALKKDRDTTTSVSVLKFLIKKHLEEAYLFESSLIKSYSECDYVVKFWGPLVEKAFKNSSIIPHWGDTIPGSLLSLGVKMKMDLRLIAINNSKLQDHGYGEVAKECSTPKYFKDKRKTVVASKALLNSVINKNAINQEKDCVYIPYLIAMGFEMHLCIVFLKSNSFYITKKVKTISFPSNLNNFAKESIEVANGLLDLVAICEAIKKQACRGKKRKCIDDCISNTTVKQKEYGTSKVVWDNVEEDELEDEVNDNEDDDDDENDDDDEDDDDDEGQEDVNDENDEENNDDEGDSD
ncbi:hypothetical protein HPULCUR_007601 [Helicostylum pulchrum]|uniref:Uncharacterized protein n=1 Tax=Helicostylum pulchrum TaxID=562976 RepID=A0ABP9Y580_9FUNG